MENDNEIVVQEQPVEVVPQTTGLNEFFQVGLYRIIAVVVAVILALVSFFPASAYFSSPENHLDEIQALDSKAENVGLLISGSAAASAAITLLPGDVGTPIANKLVDLCSDFLIVLTAIFLEKYLLTLFSLAAFSGIIPLGLLLFVIGILFQKQPMKQSACFGMGFKLLLFGVAVACVVPLSIVASNKIEETYSADVNAAVASANEVADMGTSSSESTDESTSATTTDTETDTTTDESSSSDGNPLSIILDWMSDRASDASNLVTNAASSVTDSAGKVIEMAKTAVRNLIEALAVMIVVDCVIPILVLVFMVWVVNFLFGNIVKMPSFSARPRLLPHKAEKAAGAEKA